MSIFLKAGSLCGIEFFFLSTSPSRSDTIKARLSPCRLSMEMPSGTEPHESSDESSSVESLGSSDDSQESGNDSQGSSDESHENSSDSEIDSFIASDDEVIDADLQELIDATLRDIRGPVVQFGKVQTAKVESVPETAVVHKPLVRRLAKNEARCLAVAMAAHPRLGVESPLKEIVAQHDVLMMIFKCHGGFTA